MPFVVVVVVVVVVVNSMTGLATWEVEEGRRRKDVIETAHKFDENLVGSMVLRKPTRNIF